MENIYAHCVKSVQIWSFSWFVFSRIQTEYRRNTEYLSIFSLNAGKYGPEKCPYLGFFPSVTGGESNPIVFIFLEWYRGKDI